MTCERDFLAEFDQSAKAMRSLLTEAGRTVNYLRTLLRDLRPHLPKDHPWSLGIDEQIALAGVDDWRSKAAAWLREKAIEQERINAECPAHAAAYQSWRDRPNSLRLLASQVENPVGACEARRGT